MVRRLLLAMALVFGACACFVGGAVVQRYVGLGNLRRLVQSREPKIPQIPESAQGKLHIFLLIGQSNMEGDGPMGGYQPPPQDVQNRIFCFDKSFTWIAAREPISGRGVGPSVAFAAEYLRLIEEDDVCVGLVPAARGGTNIALWQSSSKNGNPFNEAVERTLAAQHQGEIRGVLFFQGENDAEGDPDDHGEDWDDYFATHCQGLREALARPDLPIVFAQLGPNPGNTRWATVQQRQAAVDIPHVTMIVTNDLMCRPGEVHFTSPSYIEIGQRFAQAMVELSAAPPLPEAPQ